MLAAATSVMIPIGLLIICFIPVNVVGALIFYMGFQLMHEALVETWGKVNRLEYATVMFTHCCRHHQPNLTIDRSSVLLLLW